MIGRLVRWIVAVGLACIAMGAVVPTASGVGLTEVAQELRCVTCGTSLDVSDAPAAQQMKERIQRRITEGASKQQIIDEFVEDYGRQVLATPPKKGFDLVAGWLIPLGALVLGLALVPFIIRAWRRRRRPASAGGDAEEEISETDAARIAEELRDFDRRSGPPPS